MTDFGYRCVDCSASYGWDDLRYRCTCGGLFELEYERPRFDPGRIQRETPSQMRYLEFFPGLLHRSLKELSLGEGWTPTVPARLANRDDLFVKMDHLTPTYSFKDRGAVLLVALADAIDAKKIVQDSSGNAGHAVAVYAARAGIPCDIFLPADASSRRIRLIENSGAKVRKIEGSREDTARVALEAADDPHTFYASHVYNPLFFEGTKTYAYELYEHFGRLPQRLVLPLGNGTLVLGVLQAIRELRTAGCVRDEQVEVVAVQAENCCPIAESFSQGKQEVRAVSNLGTAASGIAIADPARGSEILQKLSRESGRVVVASESEIKATRNVLARRGFDVEATAAASFAAVLGGPLGPSIETVIPICGSGIKK